MRSLHKDMRQQDLRDEVDARLLVPGHVSSIIQLVNLKRMVRRMVHNFRDSKDNDGSIMRVELSGSVRAKPAHISPLHGMGVDTDEEQAATAGKTEEQATSHEGKYKEEKRSIAEARPSEGRQIRSVHFASASTHETLQNAAGMTAMRKHPNTREAAFEFDEVYAVAE